MTTNNEVISDLEKAINGHLYYTTVHPHTAIHGVVGKYFGGHSHKHNDIGIFFCDSHDIQNGFWMTNVFDPTERRAISEMAIGRSFYLAVDDGDHWHILVWDRLVTKEGKVIAAYGEPGWKEYVEARTARRANHASE